MARAMVCVLLAGSVAWGVESCLGGERADWAQIAGEVAARRLRAMDGGHYVSAGG